jgi:hypothetical protein
MSSAFDLTLRYPPTDESFVHAAAQLMSTPEATQELAARFKREHETGQGALRSVGARLALLRVTEEVADALTAAGYRVDLDAFQLDLVPEWLRVRVPCTQASSGIALQLEVGIRFYPQSGWLGEAVVAVSMFEMEAPQGRYFIGQKVLPQSPVSPALAATADLSKALGEHALAFFETQRGAPTQRLVVELLEMTQHALVH